jgi:hypothetical protein
MSKDDLSGADIKAICTEAVPLLLPRPHQDWARPCHVRTGTGLTRATSIPGLGLAPPTCAPGLGLARATSAPKRYCHALWCAVQPEYFPQ